jgi:hypothetical protein
MQPADVAQSELNANAAGRLYAESARSVRAERILKLSPNDTNYQMELANNCASFVATGWRVSPLPTVAT